MVNHDEDMRRIDALLKARDFEGALDVASRTIKLAPESFRSFANRGYVYARRKDYALAVTDITCAIQLAQREPSLYFARSRWMLELGRFADARSDLTRLLELETDRGSGYYIESAYFYRALASMELGHRGAVAHDCAHVRDGFQVFALGSNRTKQDLIDFAVMRDNAGDV